MLGSMSVLENPFIESVKILSSLAKLEYILPSSVRSDTDIDASTMTKSRHKSTYDGHSPPPLLTPTIKDAGKAHCLLGFLMTSTRRMPSLGQSSRTWSRQVMGARVKAR
ncbi:hypothetical protein E2C01_029732 [Portunus trituberculatus]|uniref:Uncharacterized protein n=1 Tax=Portunus trituberculatus TaxID=210409 RepID=A0A5B7ENP4_PORTR|nr:hypothetical protein [Portunus trituberculatus]